MSLRAVLTLATRAAAVLPFLSSGALAQYTDLPSTLPCGQRTWVSGATVSPRQDPSDIAVLAFRSSAPPGQVDYLGEGLANGINRRLIRAGLRVRSAWPLRYAEPVSPEEVREFKTMTGADYVLAGEAHPTATGAVRVRAFLFRTSDGARIASEEREAPREQLLELEPLIALSVARRVRPSLSDAARQRIVHHLTRDPFAYERAMLADALAAERTPRSVAEAVLAYSEAVRRDSMFIDAYISLAHAYADLLYHGWAATSSSELQLAQYGLAAANRAIVLDSTAAPAWTARGRLLVLTAPRTPEAAWVAFSHALAYAPRDPSVWRAYGRARLDAGDFSGAEAQLAWAVALDPNHADALSDIGDLRLYRRDYSGACQALNQAIARDPWNPYAYSLRALARLRLSETRDAWGDAETAGRLGLRLVGQAVTAVVDAYARDTAGAAQRLKVYVPRRGSTEVPRSISAWEGRLLALAAVGAGDPDNALGFLQRVRPRSGALWAVMHDPGFDPIRADPRFEQLSALSRPAGARPPMTVLSAQGGQGDNGAQGKRPPAKRTEPRTAAAP